MDCINFRFYNSESKDEKDKKVVDAEEEQTETETKKEENTLIFILEKARSIYIEKGLVGSISITRSFTVFYRSVSCDVDGLTERAALKAISATNLKKIDDVPSSFEKFASALINRCIRSLERRAKPYDKKAYMEHLTLSNTVYSVLPIIGLMSINVSCSATAASLNSSAHASSVAKAAAARAKSLKE